MNFKQAGYQAALADLGLVKEAISFAPVKGLLSKAKGLVTRAPKKALPTGGQNVGPHISGMADDTAANAFRADMNAAIPTMKSPLTQNVSFQSAAVPQTSPQATLQNIQGMKNTGSMAATPAIATKTPPPIPAGAKPPPPTINPGFTPATAGVPEGAATKPGILSRVRANPVKSVALAGGAMAGTGYLMGAGAPPPAQPMQQYDPQMQMQGGYQ